MDERKPLPVGVRACDVEPEVMRWLWKGRIQMSAMTIVASDPGVGKGVFMSGLLVKNVTRGLDWPDGQPNLLGPRNVVFIGDEEGWANTVRPRLDLIDADLERVIFCDMVKMIDLGKWVELQKQEDPALWIADPFDQMIVEPKGNSMGGWGGRLAPYKSFVAEYDTSLVAVMHATKDKIGKSATNITGGSIKFVASTRGTYVILFAPADKDKPEVERRRYVIPGKPQNNAPRPSNIIYSVRPPSDEDIARVLDLPYYQRTPKQGRERWSADRVRDVWIACDIDTDGGYDRVEDFIAGELEATKATAAERCLKHARDLLRKGPMDAKALKGKLMLVASTNVVAGVMNSGVLRKNDKGLMEVVAEGEEVQ